MGAIASRLMDGFWLCPASFRVHVAHPNIAMRYRVRRRGDSLTYRYHPCKSENHFPSWKREDADIWLVRREVFGWVGVSAEGEVVCIPWAVPQARRRGTPSGVWVSRKADKSYFYELSMCNGANPWKCCWRSPRTRCQLGFAELSIRNIVDGCATDHVAYLEGWYVVPESRRKGIGRALIRAAEQWAVRLGCTEFGSDAEIDNEVSHVAHLRSGFQETGRVRTFRKQLEGIDGT